MIDAVVCDLGNTLFYSSYRDQDWEPRLELPAGELGRRLWGSGMERAATIGAVTFDELWSWVGETLGLDERQLAEFADGLWEGVTMPAQIAAWLPQLRAKVRVVGLSNAWSDARARSTPYGLDELLEFVAYSAEIGFAKPDPRAYETVLHRLDTAPGRVIFADDRQDNIEGAVRLGMIPVHCTGPEQLIRDIDAIITTH